LSFRAAPRPSKPIGEAGTRNLYNLLFLDSRSAAGMTQGSGNDKKQLKNSIT